ncbi:MAG TPA: SDR family NAD(P)-dependent oxidoreductase [Mycobacterium sp.]|nr:SDR family NAD(P)-dependent oxidoreductase [Mycobacterium sp.]
MTRLERYGPWALVTGASDGIGRATALRLAAEGFNVILAARREPELRRLAAEIEDTHGVQTRVVAVDLAQPNGAGTLADAAAELDIGLAVLAAGFGSTGAFAEAPLDEELAMIAVNITAVAQLCHGLAGRMTSRGRGGIVLFGSILGWQGVAGQANYAATKAYVQSFAEGLHAELAPHGVDVLAVAPGPVHTGFAARAGLAMPSATTPEVVAGAVVKALGRRVTVVPGARAKLLTSALRVLPRRLRTRILTGVMAGMRADSTVVSATRK